MSESGIRVSELAVEAGLEWRGASDPLIRGVGTITAAGPDQLTFLANKTYRRHLATTRAGLVILGEDAAVDCPVPCIVAPDPYVTYARLAARFAGGGAVAPGVHPSAVVEAGAEVDPAAAIGPLAVVEAGTRIGAGTVIGPGACVGPDVVIGRDCRIEARVTLCAGVRIGDRVIIHPGAVIGADGFGLAFAEAGWIKVPQLGGVRIGDDCEIGANTTVDRGALEDTVLEEDVRLDNQIQIAHNVRIGAHTAMAGCSAVAGSASIGRHCLIGGGAGIIGHIEIADRVTITAMTLVTHSIREPGEYSSGTPLQSNRDWRRNAVRLRQLDDLAKTVARLKKER
ncbi:MAG: UDP-3-O-(3-hydroxymyristoyl)glucosamine N-acyltransferase [Pseudomonadota bacterium]